MRLLSFHEWLKQLRGQSYDGSTIRDLLEHQVYENDYLAARMCDKADDLEAGHALGSVDDELLQVYRSRARDARVALIALYQEAVS